MDEAGFRDFLWCRDVARTNRTIAAENAESVRQLLQGYEGTRRMAERRAEYDQWQLEELERDRRWLWWENVLLKVGVVAGLVW